MDIQDLIKKKPYRKEMSIFWWIRQKSYVWFITRELASLAVAYTAIVLMFLIHALSAGPDSYEHFLRTMRSTVFIVLNSIAMIGMLMHSITWFNLASRAMVVRVSKRKVPGKLITLINLVGWIIISGIVIWMLFGY